MSEHEHVRDTSNPGDNSCMYCDVRGRWVWSSEQMPANEVYQDIVKRFWDKKWPSASQVDIRDAWDNYVEGVERLAKAKPVVSEVQLQAIRDVAETTFGKWNKWQPHCKEEVWDFRPDEDGESDPHCVSVGLSDISIEQKSKMIDDLVSAVKAVLEGSDA